jgi:hypothetical protein
MEISMQRYRAANSSSSTHIGVFVCVLQTAVMLSCKIPASDIATVADYRFSLAEGMFQIALNQRFFKISRNQDPPFFSCNTSSEAFVRPVKAYIMSANCKERGTLQALESMLTEVCQTCVLAGLMPDKGCL